VVAFFASTWHVTQVSGRFCSMSTTTALDESVATGTSTLPTRLRVLRHTSSPDTSLDDISLPRDMHSDDEHAIGSSRQNPWSNTQHPTKPSHSLRELPGETPAHRLSALVAQINGATPPSSVASVQDAADTDDGLVQHSSANIRRERFSAIFKKATTDMPPTPKINRRPRHRTVSLESSIPDSQMSTRRMSLSDDGDTDTGPSCSCFQIQYAMQPS
jgi:hypothetical protein